MVEKSSEWKPAAWGKKQGNFVLEVRDCGWYFAWRVGPAAHLAPSAPEVSGQETTQATAIAAAERWLEEFKRKSSDE